MSAKHKRPFYVFAAVAAVCCMVLVTGIRGSKADDGGNPVVAGSQLTESGALIERSPGAGDITSSDADPGATGGAGTGLDVDSTATIPGPDGSPPDGGDAEVGPNSGSSLLPPGDVTVPPTSDDTSDDNGRGERDGKKGKGKDKDEQGDESGDETEADAESESESEDEDEVDPDVYDPPEDEGEEGDELEGDQSEEPIDPEATP